MLRNILLITLSFTLVTCATDDPNRRSKAGAAIGAIAGAILGNQTDSKQGKIIGAVVGAMAGAAVGGYMDKQQKEFEQALAEEQRNNDIEIQRLKDDSIKININNEVSFDFAKSAIKPAFKPSLIKVSNLLNRYEKTVVHIIGHTDSKGSNAYNQGLSEKRAQSVAGYFGGQGVKRSRLVTVGRGESQPRATNKTESGRQLNRRVELIIKPIVEGQEQKAYETPSNVSG